MENKRVWLISAKTNLHVGNENSSSYGLIDKSIQRDVLTKLPCVNSSSLKGALNEFFTEKQEKDPEFLITVFGADKKGRENKETQKGSYTFCDANILFLPLQGQKELFYRITSDELLNTFRERLATFGLTCEADNNKLLDNFRRILGNQRIEIVPHTEFKDACDDDNLPIIARNRLDNGESTNLWYEQILPQETVFYSLFLSKKDLIEKDLEGQIIQIGANATIGYGYCKFNNFKD